MNDSEQAPPKPRVPGTKRATLAVLLSMAALGFSIYGLASQVLNDDGAMVAPARDQSADTSMLNSRLEAMEARQGQLAEDMTKAMAKLDEITKTPLAAAVPMPGEEIAKGPLDDLRRKLAELEKSNAALQADIASTMQKKAGMLSDLSLTQSIRRKLQDGMNFSSERRRLSTTDLLPELDSISPAELSDRALRDDLRDLAPKFTHAEKMEKTQGFFQKLWLRMQSLVTVRPREGIARDTETGKTLTAMENAMVRHDWKEALTAADSVAAKAPTEFLGWRERLTARANAEATLDKLEDTTLTALRGKGEEMPAAFPAVQDDLTSAPSAKPAVVTPTPPAADKKEKEEEANP